MRARRLRWGPRASVLTALSQVLLQVLLQLAVAILPFAPPTPALWDGVATTSARSTQVEMTALEVPVVYGPLRTRYTRSTPDSNETSAITDDDGPRRRPREQWDMVGPALLLGGTLAFIILTAVGHLASKALLASMLSAALSAVQLARPPPPNRPG